MNNSFWNNFPDETLSPLNLAEKKWSIANENLPLKIKALYDELLVQARRDPSGYNDRIQEESRKRIQELQKEIQEEQDSVNELWREWVGLKPYVSRELKNALKCDPSKCDYTVPVVLTEEQAAEEAEKEDKAYLNEKEIELEKLQEEVMRLREFVFKKY